MSKRSKMPVTGSFPGFARMLSAFSTSVRVMERQANDWNAAWAKVKDGTLTASELGKVFVNSVEAPVDMWSQWWRFQPNPADADVPIWVALQWGSAPGNVVSRLREPLDQGEEPSASALSPLGGRYPAETNMPKVQASRVDELNIQVSCIPGGTPAAGEYIGFVKSAKRTSPLAIVWLTVPGKA